MHVDLFAEYFIQVFHALLITSTITWCRHAFIDLLAFHRRANIGPGSAFTKVALRNLGKEGSPSSPDLHIPTQY